ncbi:hypothetical protein [Nocardia sp. NPDC048505]|uniref:hypothetical protein n=1 Tax=unclassified Nocardia TaxID=2637762 RepID=UPI003403C846
MDIFARPETLAVLADHYDGGWQPWPFFWIFPLLLWGGFLLLVVFGRRRFRRDSGVGALRAGFARGEITEAQYRERLAVLEEKKR